ncbi:MAG: cytoplasmic protein [Desulfobulbus propionicus]|nr:MAG: cytoplasmic protein [Desulfobulbus propionicus]PIE60278.1 MAG: cytoplasmic protein [Desulfobulbus propionicus]
MKKKFTPIDSQAKKPKIEYPCPWQYTIIGFDCNAITALVADILEDEQYILTQGNASSGGRYVSMKLELIVLSEEQRLTLHNQFAQHEAVKIVL